MKLALSRKPRLPPLEADRNRDTSASARSPEPSSGERTLSPRWETCPKSEVFRSSSFASRDTRSDASSEAWASGVDRMGPQASAAPMSHFFNVPPGGRVLEERHLYHARRRDVREMRTTPA